MLTAVATAGAAAALSPHVSRRARVRMPRVGWHLVLAALGGAGAGLLAGTWAEALAFATLALACAFLVVVDLAELRLPDAVVLPTYPVLFAALALAAAVSGEWGRLGRAALAAGVLLAVYFVLAFINPAGMGLGDVKLAGPIGAFLGWLGWYEVLVGTAAAWLLMAAVSGVLLIVRRVGRKSELPFGPWMVAGAAVGAAWVPLVMGR
jgi:leader peptidase (prepilin peptidase)/N-methyltransferase